MRHARLTFFLLCHRHEFPHATTFHQCPTRTLIRKSDGCNQT